MTRPFKKRYVNDTLRICERGWARTTDPLLKRQMLYP